MDERAAPHVFDGEITGIKFCLASHTEISKSSISDCPISHATQLGNPFLGLPLEAGKCESCGTAEPGQCEGHFGYIELPIPIYHPSHVNELKRLLSLICLKCLKMRTHKFPMKNTGGTLERLLSSCCEETAHVSIRENKTTDGAHFLELKLPARSRAREDAWSFLSKYGYRYGDGASRTLLPSEVNVILKKLPEDAKRKLVKKGFFPQEGYIIRYLPVPPNCLSVPDVSDGVSVMSSDLSASMLKKVLRQVEIIKSSRSGEPNFESHEVEANDLQQVVAQYLQIRGIGKAARDVDRHYGVNKEGSSSATKAWLDKMKTLFISKGSGFSSRSVITGDAYKRVNEIGLPSEIAQKITFEEKVNMRNINYLQSLVDNNFCLTYKDGLATYSLKEGSKGHTFLKPGQVVNRRIMDGDIVFINRPPTTHKHSLQALSVYIHDDHTVKINPLMCGPLAADFDGDCVHLFYPQSLPAKAEVLELFSVEKQLLSSHSGNLNLQLATDALLSLKTMFSVCFFNKASAQQLAMYVPTPLPPPAMRKANSSGPFWTAFQVLQTVLPSQFTCQGDKHLISGSEFVKLDFSREAIASVISEIVTSVFFDKGPKEALDFFDHLQPLLMELVFSQGFSIGLNDFCLPKKVVQAIPKEIQGVSPLLFQLRSTYNELVQLQFEGKIQELKSALVKFVMKSSALGNLIDPKSNSAMDKIVQQIGFLGLQLSDRGKFYSKSLVEDVASLFHRKYPFRKQYPSEEFGLVKSAFIHGLDPYEEIAHSIATREVIVRSSRGLSEPGTLFKHLMAILRDVIICYDGTVRNISSNSVIQFEYSLTGTRSQSLFPAGEPVGVLAATAMSTPAYKAVLDSSPSSNSSWDLMKEIVFCRVNFKNDDIDRRVILYLNDCSCGRKYCQENGSIVVKNNLKKVSLRDAAVEFLIEYQQSQAGTSEIEAGLVGHIHLNKGLLNDSNISMHDILLKCQDEVAVLRKKKKLGYHFKRILLSASECCFFQHSSGKRCDKPCLKFFWQDMPLAPLEKISHVMSDMICPILLDTIIKGDPRISTVNIIWVSPDTSSWIRSPCSSRENGELAVEVVLEKSAVKESGDAWRIVLDCCLPVFHMVDTRRSIPYAIKQIQELLGISCAFDQAVQRLSTSVTMVTRGVLKEHLLLLASSMTCAGNLVGFDKSGIKALCRALSVQVPFTEATLYTPRRCFERAAEKCHVDSVSSIVASCSWGKHVAIGTGVKFDILWDKKEIGVLREKVDVYDFLRMVRSPNEEDIITDCLGEDVEDFELEDEYMEQPMSPEQENKAVFDEEVDMEIDDNQQPDGVNTGDSSWDKPTGWNANKSEGAGVGSGESGGWSTWGTKKSEVQQEDKTESGGWGAATSNKKASGDSSWGKFPSSNDASDAGKGWNSNKNQEPGGGSASESSAWGSWGAKKNDSQEEDTPKSGGWGAPKGDKSDDSSWDKFPSSNNASDGAKGWNSIKNKEPSGGSESSWGAKKNETEEGSSKTGGWGSAKGDRADNSTWGKFSSSNNATDTAKKWNSNKNQEPGGGSASESGGWSNWGAKKNEIQEDRLPKSGGWNAPKGGKSDNFSREKFSSSNNISDAAKGWNNSKNQDAGDGSKSESTSWSSWGKNKNEAQPDNLPKAKGWGALKEGKSDDSSWGKFTSSNNASDNMKGWKANRSQEVGSGFASESGSWGKKKTETQQEVLPKWNATDGGKSDNSTWNKFPSSSSGGKQWNASKSQDLGSGSALESNDWSQKEPNLTESSSTWGRKTKEREESAWGKKDAQQHSNSWESAKDDKKDSSWGQPSVSTWKKVGSEDSGNQRRGSYWGKDTSENKGDSVSHDVNPAGASSWDSAKEKKTESSWGQPSGSAWKKDSADGAGKWGSDDPNQSVNSQDWGSPKADDQNETKSPWGQAGGSNWKKNRQEGGRGWGSSGSGEWKSKKNRPPRTPGMPNEDSAPVPVTATRQRLDAFTPEEQDVLSEMETIMQSIRRIMHQPSYNDGDPLPAEDQSYIIDNVLSHHPDKEAKMGAGIDYIMVSKHSSFQDSRCLYVVSTDGRKEDFSYRKCLENFIKGKFPDVAEAFIPKYFRRRPGRNREQQE